MFTGIFIFVIVFLAIAVLALLVNRKELQKELAAAGVQDTASLAQEVVGEGETLAAEAIGGIGAFEKAAVDEVEKLFTPVTVEEIEADIAALQAKLKKALDYQTTSLANTQSQADAARVKEQATIAANQAAIAKLNGYKQAVAALPPVAAAPAPAAVVVVPALAATVEAPAPAMGP